jgi:hypothetical protein
MKNKSLLTRDGYVFPYFYFSVAVVFTASRKGFSLRDMAQIVQLQEGDPILQYCAYLYIQQAVSL